MKETEQGEKKAFRMGENSSKWSNCQRINLQNIQAAQAPQYQEDKTPLSKSGQKA